MFGLFPRHGSAMHRYSSVFPLSCGDLLERIACNGVLRLFPGLLRRLAWLHELHRVRRGDLPARRWRIGVLTLPCRDLLGHPGGGDVHGLLARHLLDLGRRYGCLGLPSVSRRLLSATQWADGVHALSGGDLLDHTGCHGLLGLFAWNLSERDGIDGVLRLRSRNGAALRGRGSVFPLPGAP